MSFLDLAKKRYSCRAFKDWPVEKDKLMRVLEAGRVAPSAANKQPWRFIVIDEKNLLQQIKGCYHRQWIESAPLLIVICGDHSRSWKRDDGKDHCDIDIAIATDHITLAATDEGLATCWLCKFNAAKCAEILKLPSHLEPVVLLPLGYPDDMPNPNRHESQRLLMEQVLKWNG